MLREGETERKRFETRIFNTKDTKDAIPPSTRDLGARRQTFGNGQYHEAQTPQITGAGGHEGNLNFLKKNRGSFRGTDSTDLRRADGWILEN
jgi:hypothetical protein